MLYRLLQINETENAPKYVRWLAGINALKVASSKIAIQECCLSSKILVHLAAQMVHGFAAARSFQNTCFFRGQMQGHGIHKQTSQLLEVNRHLQWDVEFAPWLPQILCSIGQEKTDVPGFLHCFYTCSATWFSMVSFCLRSLVLIFPWAWEIHHRKNWF